MTPRIALAATLLLAACESVPVNVLESRGDSSIPDSNADDASTGDAADPCSDTSQRCYDFCGSDLPRMPTCANGDWRCPNGQFLSRDFEQVCEGKLSGPCGPNNTCERSVCGSNHRCLPECPDGIGRCRMFDPQESCCTDAVVDGLCLVLGNQFAVCPIGTYEPDNCGPSGDEPLCTGACDRYPILWPHDRSADFYWTFFGEWAVQNGCAFSSCHADLSLVRSPPFIPQARSDLDDPSSRNLAIAELWQSILPGDSSSKLLRVHRPQSQGGSDVLPLYTPAQIAALNDLLVNAAAPCDGPDGGQ